jgi:hypothetical protein
MVFCFLSVLYEEKIIYTSSLSTVTLTSVLINLINDQNITLCNTGMKESEETIEADHSPLSSVDVTNDWHYTSALPLCLYDMHMSPLRLLVCDNKFFELKNY